MKFTNLSRIGIKTAVLKDVIVLLGAYNLDVKIENGAQHIDVKHVHIHPDWRAFSEKYDADLAILALSQIVEFTKYIRPICVPENDPPVDVYGSIVGKILSIVVRRKMFTNLIR